MMKLRSKHTSTFLLLFSWVSIVQCSSPRVARLDSDGNATVQCSYWRELGSAGVSFNVTLYNATTNESSLADYDVVFKASWGGLLVSKDEIVQTINAQGGDGEAEFNSWMKYDDYLYNGQSSTLAFVTLNQPSVGVQYTCNFFYDAPTKYGSDESTSAEFVIISSTGGSLTSQLTEHKYNGLTYNNEIASWYLQAEDSDMVLEMKVHDNWASFVAANYTFNGLNSVVEVVFYLKTLNSTYTYSYDSLPALQVRAVSSDQTSEWFYAYGSMEGSGYSEGDHLIFVFYLIGILVVVPALFLAAMVAALIRGKTCRDTSAGYCQCCW